MHELGEIEIGYRSVAINGDEECTISVLQINKISIQKFYSKNNV